MTWLEGFILGLTQGLAEFLPISSSGHLALLQHFFGVDESKVLCFSVLLHFGTLVSLVAAFWRDILDLIAELFRTLGDLFSGRGLRINSSPTRRLGVMIVIATIPTALAGLLLEDFFNGLYSSVRIIAICLIITGILLWVAEKAAKGWKNIYDMRFRDAFIVGCFQAVAICPGISRSGSTLVGSLFTGLERELAVRYAFLISLPSILGAVILEAPDAISAGIEGGTLGPILLGVIVSAVSGFIAIKWMIKLVSKKKLYYFSYYVWIVAIAVLIYSFIG